MGDSFFGFNTNLPPLTDEELRALTEQGNNNNDDDDTFDTLEEYGGGSNNRGAGSAGMTAGNSAADTPVDVDVYDFATLRHELGVDNDDYDDRDMEDEKDNLGDELIEEGDDLNDITFGDAPVGKDFDFSGNTKRLATTMEEEAFFVKPKPSREESKKGGFLNPWADTSMRSGSGIEGSRGFGEPSPITSTKSIWGNFTAGFSSSADNTGFSSLSGSQASNLSPFTSNANRQLLRSQQQPQPQPPQQSPFMGEGISPTASLAFQQQQQGRPVTLKDLEANIQREQAAQRYRAAAAANEQTVLGGKATLSVAELEAALRSQQQQHQQQRPMPPHLMQQQPPPSDMGMPLGFNQQPDPVQLLALKQQQELSEQQLVREMKRREQQQRKSKYDGLMSQHDKDLVNRIQLSQLASGDPYNDDFYYQVYSSLRQHAGIPLQTSQQHQLVGNNDGNTGSNNGRHHRGGRNREENTMQRMQQQLQRIVNEAKRRPKQSQVSLEGALGKITSLTVRNPRQVLQVPQASNSSTTENAKDSGKEDNKEDKASSTSASTPKSDANGHSDGSNRKPATSFAIDRRRVLMMTEQLYNLVLEIEQMGRQGPQRPLHQQQQSQDDNNNTPGQTPDEKALVDEFNQKLANKLEKLWNILCLNADPPQPITNASMAAPPPPPTFLISLLSISKGKKLIPRIVRQLKHEQILTLIKVCLGHFSQLQVCRYVIYPGTTVAQVDEAQRQMFVTFEEVETFMGAVVPPLLAFIAESPLSVVNGLLDLFLSHNPILAVAQTKPGLAFLTMLLSRAEILKQGGGQLQGLPPPTPEEVHHWQELYGTLFNTLKGRYLTIFPSLYYLVPINPSTPMMQLSLAVDDMYVWQFLAAMAVGASMDQQHILVTEVRDRVMENIVLAKRNRLPMDQASHRISNVNLFLHALGLDASQVSVPL